MPPRRLWLPFWVIVALIILAAAWGWSTRSSRPPRSLPQFGLVPPFELIDQFGHPVALSHLKGQPWLASFIFTRCAGQCPVIVSHLVTLRPEIPPEVRFVSFTVDPAWDTPARLAEYAAQLDAAPEQWLFVTGEKRELVTLVREGFRLAMQDTPENMNEPVTHSARLALVDRAGVIRGYYLATDEEELDRLVDDLASLTLAR